MHFAWCMSPFREDQYNNYNLYKLEEFALVLGVVRNSQQSKKTRGKTHLKPGAISLELSIGHFYFNHNVFVVL